MQLHDSYLSVAEALRHAGWEIGKNVEILWTDSEGITDDTVDGILSGADGVILPGGFGSRGVEGMIVAAEYCRTHRIPFFGICLGMQVAAIGLARGLLGLCGADSREFSPDTPHPVVDLMPDQNGNLPKGGTMRLGAYPCRTMEGSRLREAYGEELIHERHRHRYEFNNDYREAFERAGAVFSGRSPDGRLVEAMELPAHPFYVAVQYHPEFKSRPNRPHPLFRAFVRASAEHGNQEEA